jgi:hypothetical protein
VSDYETTGDLNEQIYYERLDVDMEMAAFEAEGRRYARRQAASAAALAEGDIASAANLCPHGHVGLLKGLCSEHDSRYGEDGYRCYECGNVVSDIGGRVLIVEGEGRLVSVWRCETCGSWHDGASFYPTDVPRDQWGRVTREARDNPATPRYCSEACREAVERRSREEVGD